MANQEEPVQDVGSTLKRSTAALRDAGVSFVVGGSLAFWARGGPSYVGDLDVVVKPDDAERALEALKAAGFEERESPEEWLLKVSDGESDVDVIFGPTGVQVTDEVMSRGEEVEVAGMSVPLMALEDVFTTKLLSLKEHYLDYEDLIAFARSLREKVAWQEVRERTERSPFARAFFTMVEGLEIVPPPGGEAPAEGAARAG